MDYLDPAKKRSHRIRLYIGYGLLTIAVAIATVILVYIGNGFYVDRNTGDLIQNGQLFVNSDPDGAKIYLNGREQRAKTAGRLVVPSGIYNVTIKQEGYRDWVATNVILDGGVVERLDYARLLPKTLSTSTQQTFATAAYSVTESADRRYLALLFADHPLSIFIIDLTQPEAAPKEVVLPKTLFSDQAKIGQLALTEWAESNKHFIIKNTFNGANQDYVLVRWDIIEQSVNLTRDLNLAGADISLRDRAFDRYYAFNPGTKILSTVSLDNKTAVPLVADVTAFKSYGEDTVLFVTATDADKGKVQVRLLKGDTSYLMREVAESPTYLLALGRLGSSPILAIGVTGENKITVLRDPLTYLKANPKQAIPLATTVLKVKSPTEVSFSTDMSVVIARGGQSFGAHNFDEDRTTVYELPIPISATPLQWVDGKHLTVVSGADAYMFDFNGENVQKLVASSDGIGAFFDNSYQSVYTFTSGSGGKVFNVNKSLLRPKE